MILVSSRPGTAASFDPGTGRATFTEALRSVLHDLEPARESFGSWPPNLGDLEARVPARLAELLGEARDRTQVYHHTPWGVFAEQLGGKAPGRQVSLLASAVPRDWQPAGFAAASRTGSSVWLDLRWVVDRNRATAVLADPVDADAAADLNRAEEALEAAERDFAAAQEAVRGTAVTALESRRWFTIEVTGRGDPATVSDYSSIVHGDAEWTKASQPAFVLRLDVSTATPATADNYHREVAGWLIRLSVDFPRASVIVTIRAAEAVDALLMAVLLAQRLDVRRSEDGRTWVAFTRTSASIIVEQSLPGTDLSQVVAALADAARRRDLPVPVLSPVATIAAAGAVSPETTALAAVSDVARQLVAELESGQAIAGPPGRDPDEALLCSVRDLMPTLFRALLRSYAANRTGSGWGVSLAVAAQADEDLRAWLAAAMEAQRRPDSADDALPLRYGTSPGDAVLLELARTHQNAEAWKSLITSPEAATAADLVRGNSQPDLTGLSRGVIACLGQAGALPAEVRPADRDWWAEESWLALRAEQGSRASLSDVLSRFNRPDAGTGTWGARVVIGLAALATLPEPILRETASELRRILHNLPEGDVIP